MDPARRHRSRSRQPRSSSRGQLQSRLVHGLVHGTPAPPPTNNYGTGTRHETLQVRRQRTPDSSTAGGPPWDTDSRLTTPPAAPMRNFESPANDGRGRGQAAASASPVAGKSKRVRTGCLTCRERHLKCDEGVPDCNNCRKSNRECRRGIRLNFIDVQVKDPPCLPPTADWSCSLLSLPGNHCSRLAAERADLVHSSSNPGRVALYCFRVQGGTGPVPQGRSVTIDNGIGCVPQPAQRASGSSDGEQFPARDPKEGRRIEHPKPASSNPCRATSSPGTGGLLRQPASACWF